MSKQDVVDKVIALLKRRSGHGADAIAAGDRLHDLGIDSIDMAYLLSTFEREHDTDFDDEEFDPERYETIGDLAEAIDARLRV